MDIGPGELIAVAIVIVLLFGAKKLPELARGLGQAKHEFENAARDRNQGDSPDSAGSQS